MQLHLYTVRFKAKSLWGRIHKTHISNERKIFQESKLVGGWPVSYLQCVEELNWGQVKSASGRQKGLNLGPPDYKSSAMTTLPSLPSLFSLSC